MAHANIQRKTIYFGGRNYAGNPFAMGVPGPAWIGGFARPAVDAATVDADFAPQLPEAAYQRIDINQSQGGLPIRGIGIAPDSAIYCADIALMGRDGEIDRHRISPGNPMLGCLEQAEYALVSIPNAIPGFATGAGILFWDSVDVATPEIGAGSKIAAFPLRLELYRGETLPMRQRVRAPYVAHAIFDVQSARALIMCVDGRRRIELHVYPHAPADVTLIAAQFEAFVRDNPGASLVDCDFAGGQTLTINGAASVNPTADQLNVYSFDGGPMTMVEFGLTPNVAGFVQVRAVAWDD